MTREQIIATVTDLRLPPGDFAIHASAVMVLHDLLDEAGDVDIVARGAAWSFARRLGTPVAGRQDLCVSLPGRDVEIWSGWLEDDVDALIDGADTVAGLPCVGLDEVLRFKLGANRPKDAPHIAVLRAHLVDTPKDGC